MFLKRLFGPPAAEKEAAGSLYRAAVAQARDPAFYLNFGIADTVDGRFDMIVIHVMLIMRRLREAAPGEVTAATAQRLFDLMFRDMDRSLRELGVGDMSIGKHIKKMAKAFYGRATVLEAGLDAARHGHTGALVDALRETVYRHAVETPGGDSPGRDQTLDRMAGYLLKAVQHLSQQSVGAIATGAVDLSIAPA